MRLACSEVAPTWQVQPANVARFGRWQHSWERAVSHPKGLESGYVGCSLPKNAKGPDTGRSDEPLCFDSLPDPRLTMQHHRATETKGLAAVCLEPS